MSKFLSAIFLTSLMILITVLVMIHGWGLEPKSWWWIIGGGVGLKLIVGIMEIAVKKEN